MGTVVKNCTTCKYRTKTGTLDDIKPICWGCKSHDLWTPLVEEEPIEEPNDSIGNQKEPTTTNVENSDPYSSQVAGSHYTNMAIQPIQYAVANKLDFFQKDILKYITRIKGDKAKRLEDLEKAKDYLNKYIHEIKTGNWSWN